MSEDALEHIAVCQTTNQLYTTTFIHHNSDRPTLPAFLLLESCNGVHLATRAMHLHALYLTYNRLRNQQHENIETEQYADLILRIYLAYVRSASLASFWGRFLLRSGAIKF